MPIRSSDFQQVFGDFSDLFAQAEKKNATIHEKAVPLLMGAVAYCAARPRHDLPDASEVRQRAQNAWSELVQHKQGQMLAQADIWEWIRKWFPDPVQGERIPNEIANFMERLK
jgi:predicted lipoprotein